MGFAEGLKTVWESPRQYAALDFLLDIIPECSVILFCSAFYLFTSKFGMVRVMVRRLHRLNMVMCMLCAAVIATRCFFQKRENFVMEHWLTYIINYNLFFICISDGFTVLAAAVATCVSAGFPGKKTRTYTIWVFFLIVGFILSGCVVGSTVDFIPSQIDKFTDKSFVYMGCAGFIIISAFIVVLWATYSEKALKEKWGTYAHNYVQLRYQFRNIRAMTRQAGFCWTLKGLAVATMTFYHQTHHVFHSCFLIGLTAILTFSFLCQHDSRLHILSFLGLHHNQFARSVLRIKRDGRQLSSMEAQSQMFDSLSEQWESHYKASHPNEIEMPALPMEGLTNTRRLKQVKDVLNTISQIVEQRRVSPMTHAELFKVEGGSRPTLTVIEMK